MTCLLMLRRETLLQILWVKCMEPPRPPVAGHLAVGAGAGSVGSLLATLAGWYLTPPSHRDHLVPPSPLTFCEPEEERRSFYLGLLLGLVLGVFVGALLDLLYLYKQNISLTIRTKLATLQLRGSSR